MASLAKGKAEGRITGFMPHVRSTLAKRAKKRRGSEQDSELAD